MLSGTRIFKIVTGLVAASLFTAGLAAEDRIDVAIRQYRRGLPQEAEYYWSLAAREAKKDSAFKLHKLRAFLDLRLARIPEATSELEAALAVQDDAFLNYLLARIHLDFRRFPEAADAYARAVKQKPALVPASQARVHLDLLPFSCAEEMPPAALSAFQDIQLYGELWDHSLHDTELAAAAWTSASIRRRFGGASVALLPVRTQNGLLNRLLAAPDNLAAHAACIASFADMEKKILGGIAVPKRLLALRSNQDAYYRLRAFWFGNEQSLELLGRHLNVAGRGVEALHVYRAIFFRRFHRLDFKSQNKKGSEGTDLAYTIRELAAVYGSIGRNQDRTVLLRVADAIETVGYNDLLVAREASQKQDNRECLYLLSALQPGRSAEMFRRLRARDAAAVDSEFSLVFLPLYGEKGDPPP